ncbi:MAG: crossover junction endodeoxyribonuclease RuvC [Gemmatimonadota bacterium]|nr:crossover junction endodeoxyribonuclease RuvC [Gemmatimonadota bacterium]
MKVSRFGEGVIVLGVDPGTAITGFGIVRVDRRRQADLVECGVIRTSSKAPLVARIREIHEALLELITEFSPAAMSVEDVFQGKNVRSALTLGHARGAILLAGALRDLQVVEYTPREIKKAIVGYGNASKNQVADMVQRHLRLQTAPKPSDASDGVAAALCHGFTGSLPVEIGPRLVLS